MPRRSLDQGGKPFEFRTGIGGLPQLGGMFRSGDPATIPPHKFHLLANMRRTTAGTITRPGLSLEFDTGIQECINGLTEDPGLQGGALMLYPGNIPSSNAATFRAIFPDASMTYSEFVSSLYGPATQSAAKSPVVQGLAGYVAASTEPVPESSPFLFRGQAHYFARVDRNGVPLQLALIAMELPERSFLQASNCWLQEQSGVVPACPGPAGIVAPPQWFPFQHPIGSAGVVTYIDSPFAANGIWINDQFLDRDQIVASPERIDDTLTGQSGVSEVLYFLVIDDPTNEVRLLRWDGAQQTTEQVTVPIGATPDFKPVLGLTAVGPFMAACGDIIPLHNWAAYRNEAGSWVTIAGCSVGDVQSYGPALSWGGRGQLVVRQSGTGGCGEYGNVTAFQQGAANFDTPSCVAIASSSESDSSVDLLFGAVVVGASLYALANVSHAATGLTILGRGSFLTGLPTGYVILRHPGDGASGPFWIQAVGDRVYVGGRFGRDVVAGVVSAPRHAVYDVTDVEAVIVACAAFNGGSSSVFPVYDVLATNEPGSISQGALPAVPNDDHGGEGFQAS